MHYNVWAAVTYTAFLIFFGYFLVLIAYYFFLGILGFFEGRRWAWKREEEDYAFSFFSTFSLPVSIIIPAHNEELWIADCVKSAIQLNYPKFEVIVVDDGSTDGTFGVLDAILDLKAIDMVYIKHYKDGNTHDILQSRKYPNVSVVRKSKGLKKAGAVNSGLNIAKYDYICVTDGDTVLEQDSLLKVMAEVERDPERIVGIGSYFGIANGFDVRDGIIYGKRFLYRPVVAYQHLEYVRSFFGNRISWSRLNAMPIVAGGFGIWRKDLLYELGGYSAEFTCEDLELTFRAHKYIADHKKDYRIVMLPYYVCWTDGPANIRSLISQRDRWQRVEIETVMKYRSMFLNPRYKSFGFVTFPYYVLYEVLGVFFELASLAFVLIGALCGMLDPGVFFAFLLLMVGTQLFLTLMSIFSFIRTQRLFPTRYVAYLIFLGLVESFAYRWILSYAKISGTVNYFRGKRVFDQYERQRTLAGEKFLVK